MKRLLLVLTFAVLVIGLTNPVMAGDPFNKEEECRKCTENAEIFWQMCVNTIGDEGDAQCRDEADIYLANCQREFCID